MYLLTVHKYAASRVRLQCLSYTSARI